MRGQAGTHDIGLARQTLEQLKTATSESSEVGLVRYDKSSHEGRGDRAPDSKWQQVKGKVDVVLFEGWMLGFKPLTDQAAEKVHLLENFFASHYSVRLLSTEPICADVYITLMSEFSSIAGAGKAIPLA